MVNGGNAALVATHLGGIHEVAPSTSPAALAPAALQALCGIARFHQVAADAATLAHQLGLQPSEPIGTREKGEKERCEGHSRILDWDR